MIRSTDFELLMRAMENVGNTYGGNTKTLLHSIVREVRRLERYEADQEAKERTRLYNAAKKEYEVTGKWPKGYGDNDDDIPF